MWGREREEGWMWGREREERCFGLLRRSTVFVDNLPIRIRKISVYNLFSKFGKIKDVFIPNKLSKITKQSFGFVRFSDTSEAALAISNVHDSWCWGGKLMVNYPKFLRNQDSQSYFQDNNKGKYQRSSNEDRWRIDEQQWKPNGCQWKDERFRGKKFSRIFGPNLHVEQYERFKERNNQSAVKVGFNKTLKSHQVRNSTQNLREPRRGKEIWRKKGIPETSKQGEERNARRILQDKENGREMETIDIQPSGNGWLLRSAVGKIKRLVTTREMTEVFKKERNVCVKIKPIGGRFVVITFPDVHVRNEVIKDSLLANWFDELKEWKGEPAQLERFVWLGCHGMPLDLWSTTSFRMIGSKWGHYMQVDNNTLKEISYVKGRILIATNSEEKIEGKIKLNVNGKQFVVNVIEEGSFRSVTPLLISQASVEGVEEDYDVENSDKERGTEVNLMDDMADLKGNNADKDDNVEEKGKQKDTGVDDLNLHVEKGINNSELKAVNTPTDSDMNSRVRRIDFFVAQEEVEENKEVNSNLSHGLESMVEDSGGPILESNQNRVVLFNGQEKDINFLSEDPLVFGSDTNVRASQMQGINLEVDLNLEVPKIARKELRNRIHEACSSKGDDDTMESFINSIANGSTQNLVLQELQSSTAMAVRMGIDFSKEDMMVMSKLIEEDANRFAVLRRNG